MYELLARDFIRRQKDGVIFPSASDNGDYIEYLRWLGNGNIPTPYIPPPPAKKKPSRDEAQADLVKAGFSAAQAAGIVAAIASA